MSCCGTLRQRVDVARLEARGHDEVAGALGRGLDEERRLDLDEARRVVDVADRPAPAATASQEALLERLPAQVEVAVLEAQRLVDLGVGLVDRERRRLGRREHVDRARAQLDLARGELGVLGAREALRERALDRSTNSVRTSEATAWASGDSVASITTWVMP